MFQDFICILDLHMTLYNFSAALGAFAFPGNFQPVGTRTGPDYRYVRARQLPLSSLTAVEEY